MSATQTLRTTNQSLRMLIDELAIARENPRAVTCEHLAGVLSELLAAGELLRDRVGAECDDELTREIAEYQQNVERLRTLLPGLQAKLLTERAHLESERAHLEAAAAWAKARKSSS